MPSKDPVTGCMVMTLGEFLSEEAAREGCEPHDILDEIHREMDNDNARIVAEWKKPEEALKILKTELKQEYDPNWNPKWGDAPVNPESVVEVLEVIEAEHQQHMRSAKGHFIARVRMAGGEERKVKWYFSHYSATRLDPEDGDEGVEWL
jgi:hypothetical protein